MEANVSGILTKKSVLKIISPLSIPMAQHISMRDTAFAYISKIFIIYEMLLENRHYLMAYNLHISSIN